MKITTQYLFHIVGEDTDQIARLHSSTIKRIKAFAIAIHIPVALWAVTGYILAAKIFGLEEETAQMVSLFCASLIYLIERLVIAAPKIWFVNVGRILIGVVIAVLGASTVDLVIFDREITQQLLASERQRIAAEYDQLIFEKTAMVISMKKDWFRAQAAANCEANGTCGSGLQSVGPIYRELAKQAETLRQDHLAGQQKLEEMKTKKATVLARNASHVVAQTGLLGRIEALHEYTMANKTAFIAWTLFFLLVLLFELMVVLSKLVFGETVDDRISVLREQINEYKAMAFKEAATSPVANADRLLGKIYAFSD